MVYSEDEDLEFLGQMESSDLNDLVYCLTHDKDGAERVNEELTKSEQYKRFQPDHHQYWKEIAAEIQCFGSNIFAMLFRNGKGILYKEVMTDVCRKLKIDFDQDDSAIGIENVLMMKILSESIGKMSEEEHQQIAGILGIAQSETIKPETLLAPFQAAFVAGGLQSYKLALIVANSVSRFIFGHGLELAGDTTVTRRFSILAGIGLIQPEIWPIFEIAGPAYRVTIPAIILVTTLRRKWLSQQQPASQADA